MSFPGSRVFAACLSLLLWAGCTGGVNPLLGQADESSGGESSVLGLGTEATRPVAECARPLSADQLTARVVELTNQIRVRHGLAPLKVNEVLEFVAEEYACEHIEDNFYELLGGPEGEGLSHYHPLTGEGPGDRAIRAGYRFVVLGENLAGGQRTPEEVVDDWMASPGHRDNILAPQWREIGVGVQVGGHFDIYWVQMFGDPLPP